MAASVSLQQRQQVPEYAQTITAKVVGCSQVVLSEVYYLPPLRAARVHAAYRKELYVTGSEGRSLSLAGRGGFSGSPQELHNPNPGRRERDFCGINTASRSHPRLRQHSV